MLHERLTAESSEERGQATGTEKTAEHLRMLMSPTRVSIICACALLFKITTAHTTSSARLAPQQALHDTSIYIGST